MTNEHKYRDEDWLRQEYHGEKKTCQEIADELGCSESTISNWLDRHGIEARSATEASNLRHERERPEWATKKWLQEKYHGEGLSAYEIANELEVTSSTVAHHLNRVGVETRSQEDSTRLRNGQRKYHSKDWLQKQYVSNEKSSVKIAEELDVAPETILYWINKHGIESRSLSEAQENRNQSGENNPRWNGGREHYYGPNWNRNRNQAIERDGGECVICGMTRGRHRRKYDQDLHVHHIRPIADFEERTDANALENLITLCREHHYEWEGIHLRPQY